MIDTTRPIIFRYKIDWIGGCVVILSGSLFTTIGVFMIVSGVWAGWFVSGFFGAVLLGHLLRCLPNCSFVRISDRGVELREWFRSVLFPWEEIEAFEYCDANPHECVEIVIADSAPDAGERIRIPPVYRIVPLIFANLLNDWMVAVANETTKDPPDGQFSQEAHD